MPEDIRPKLWVAPCVSQPRWAKGYDRLAAASRPACCTLISQVTTLTAAFLNAAIGQLYGHSVKKKFVPC